MHPLTRLSLFIALLANASYADDARLPKDRYLDKCRGAWAGQMIGVSFGAPHEFRSNGAIIEGPLQTWGPERLSNAIDQDDCYVEMTFLKALEDYGLDVTFEEAGKAFAASEYPLWHANDSGRTNCRNGIMPPLSGYPRFNRHADDIDFQIEADLFGILCPGLPNASNDLCDVFGHVMNYGDGVYGGMFVSGMYAAAYFEDKDVEKVVRAGLACIPEASTYHQCISDVLQWHKENADWKATWRKIEDKWQDDVDCSPGNKFNIDAKLNGAYIVVGLLYGEGDMAKTLDVTTRCGQDADCNPSNAAGVLGCMLGFSSIDDVWKSGIEPIKDKNFSHTNYSFTSLIPVCQKVTEQILARAGGKTDGDAYVIPVQSPMPPATLEQWTDQKRILGDVIPKHVVNAWKKGWQVLACGTDMEPGLKPEVLGRSNVLMLHPVSQEKPAVMTGPVEIPAVAGSVVLQFRVASHPKGNWELRIFIDDCKLLDELIDTKGKWIIKSVDMKRYAGKTVMLRVENAANDWAFEAGFFDTISTDVGVSN